MKFEKNLGLNEWRVARRKRPDRPLLPAHARVDIFTVESAIESDQLAINRLRDDEIIRRAISYSPEEDWLAERTRQALLMFRECVEVNPGKHGGVPVLRGTRFPIAQVFAEISEGLSIDQLAADFDLDRDMLRKLLEGLAIHLDRPFAQ